MNKESIVIGCDDAGIELKEVLKEFVKNLGYNIEDVGVNSKNDNTIYPMIAEKTCKMIKDSGYSKLGILICGTGMGMCITANKFPRIYAAVCHDNFSAERAKLSNNANVLCMGARVIGHELAKKITKEWLSLEFIEGRSSTKVKAIQEIDAMTRNCKE